MNNSDILIVNATGADVSDFHEVVIEAIRNGGQFGEDFSDVFSLRRTDKNERANLEGRQAWILDFA